MREEDVELGRIALERGLLNQKDLNDSLSQFVVGEGKDLGDILLSRKLVDEENVQKLREEVRKLLEDRKAGLETGTGAPEGIPPEVAKALKQPGLHMGKFIRVEEVGRGNLGEVWKAWDVEANLWRALKLLTNFRRGDIKEYLEGALIGGRVQHPNLVRCHETGITEGAISIPFLVMDYVPGENLESLRARGLAPERAARILRDASAAVHEAHKHGVLHLDLKPGNILVEASGDVRVTDFGTPPPLASVDLLATQLLPRAAEIRGTPAYMAPEQALGRTHDITVRTDVYGLGATLYFLVTARPPFEAESPVNTCLKAIHEEPPRPVEFHPTVNPELEAIVLRAMAKDPVKRYESAKQMADDLDRVLQGAPIQSDDEMRFTQGIAALHAGRIEESIHMFKDMVRLGGLGREAIVRRLDDGEQGLSLAIDQQPKNYDVRTQRAILRLGKAMLWSLDGKDPAEPCKGALDDFTKAVALRPDNSSARLNRANILIFSARYARGSGKDVRDIFQMALDDLNHAAKVDPTNAVALHNRGTVYFYLARETKKGGEDPEAMYLRAIDDFTASTILEPSNAYVLKDLGVLKVALAKHRMSKRQRVKDLYEQALDHLSKAIRVNAALYGAWFERGQVHFALKAFNHATRDWERALEIDPSRAEAVRPLIEEARTWAAKRGTTPPQPL